MSRTARIHFGAASVSLLLFPVACLARELPELLKPVENSVVESLQSRANHGLRGQLYFARRYRIVDIDFAVLRQEGAEFTITPFTDLQLKLAAHQLRGPSSSGELTEWQGRLMPSQEVYGIDAAGNRTALPAMPVDLWVGTRDHGASQTVSGRLPVLERGLNIVIQPIEDDPRFHIIYEEDPDKVARGTGTLDAVEREKLQKYQHFREQLDQERARATQPQ